MQTDAQECRLMKIHIFSEIFKRVMLMLGDGVGALASVAKYLGPYVRATAVEN